MMLKHLMSQDTTGERTRGAPSRALKGTLSPLIHKSALTQQVRLTELFTPQGVS